ncbi:MAG: hypothetical protein JEZ06_22615 [Anaerolineaceae bacterium]|nr:hypothetical protein [Anaerolineaceae bacterium]
MNNFVPKLNLHNIYSEFETSITAVDCGEMCRPHNPNGKPFCCDICQAVPAAYHQEWDFFSSQTDLWHIWRGNECAEKPENPSLLLAETPEQLLLLACKGPGFCQREYRALSCRQFPFFPYVTADYRFLGLAYEWHFEQTCWVINNLEKVKSKYQQEFIKLYDQIFALWQDEFDSYAIKSEEMRTHFIKLKRRIPILHRNGNFYLLSPGSERIVRTQPEQFKTHGLYRR